MKKLILVFLMISIAVSFAFAFNIQVGGGVEVASFWTSGFALPTINLSFGLPISDNLSVTGQIGSILTQQMNYITTYSATQSSALLALIGFRYTFKSTSSDIERFVGVDAGIISNFVSLSGGVSPIVGINGGYIFPIVSGFEGYVKGALRLMLAAVPTTGQIGNTFPLSLPVIDLTTGLNFSF
uniref:Uncharacterized protein n=1 Tax=Mesoaciditoga lauensis TaxID=1495039 RepID=A0A7V3VT58_9BACT